VKHFPARVAGLAAVIALVLGLSGCNVRFSPYAAVVNGTEISQAQLRSALSAIAANASYKCAIESSGTSHVQGAGDGTYNSTFTAQVLSILVQDKAVHQYIERLHLSEPASLPAIALSQLEQSTAPPSTCPGSGDSLMQAFVPSYRDQLIKFQVDEDALSAHLAGTSLEPGSLEAFVARDKNLWQEACVSVIEVASKATALSLRSQLAKGASFASLAKAHSLDTSSAPNGGYIGCVADSEFTAPLGTVLAALSVGHVSSPVAFSSDWLLLVVTSRQAESYSELVSSLNASQQTTLNTVFPRLLKAAKVQLDPQFGSWVAKGSIARVVANAGPASAIVPNSSANLGTSVTSGTSASG
jgi:parvulin-like peptidyl-prolyl isomerase